MPVYIYHAYVNYTFQLAFRKRPSDVEHVLDRRPKFSFVSRTS